MERKGQNIGRLVEVMRRLLGPSGCPWDRAQTLESLRAYVLEEAFEVVEAIDRGDWDELREELGDLLLQVVFQAELARAAGRFDLDDVIDAVADKLVRRHPHVFGESRAADAAEALASWERRKREEKSERGALDGVPRALPALLRAMRVGEKAAAVGYDWPDADAVRRKVDEELAELDAARARADRDAMQAELGDVLFSLASLARKDGVDAEAALRGALDRFERRFRHAEATARASGRHLHELDADALDALWNEAKRAVG